MVTKLYWLFNENDNDSEGEVVKFMGNIMEIWRVELTAGEKCSIEVKIQRGIFQRDALSQLLFIIAMTALGNAQVDTSYINCSQSMYMDVMKLFAKK